MAKQFKPKDDWPDKFRPNLTARTPYPYKTDPDNPHVWVPDLEVIKYVEQALDYLDNDNSLQSTADWLSVVTGKPITITGLNYWWKLKRDRPGNPRADKIRAARRKRIPKTRDEALEKAAKRKLQGARISEARQKRKLEELAKKKEQELLAKAAALLGPEPSDKLASPSILSALKADIPSIEENINKNVIFEPNPGPQYDFLSSIEQEVLYGGAAGGGKSFALIADPMRYFDNKNFRGVFFRRTNDELREIKWKSRELYEQAFPGVKWREKDSVYVFPSKAELWLTYLERDEDVLRYQGQTFCYIAFDELTQYPTPFAWDYMRSRLRTTDQSLPLFMRATCNPEGPGVGWVKRMFVDPAPANTPFVAQDINTGDPLVWKEGNSAGVAPGTPLFYRKFIPAKLRDNPYLTKDGQYEANLLSLPEAQRRRLLDGEWSLIDGAAFPEFNVNVHVIQPYDIPKSWRRFRSCDYGYSSFAAVHWFAIDPVYETLIVYRELYVSGMTGRELARKIIQIERDADEHMMYGILDSSVWHQRGNTGPSIAEEMISEGCRWRPSDRTAGARINGKNRLHELLKMRDFGDYKSPGIVFFNTCRQIIADLPVIPVDPKGGEDIDERYASDHAYDSIRYGVMSRPRAQSPWDTYNTSIMPSYRPADLTFGY